MLRGLDQRHEQNPEELLRDTRTLGQRIVDFYKNPLYVCILLALVAASLVLFPEVFDVIFLFGIFSFVYGYTRKSTLPFRMPMGSGVSDYNDPKPGSNKPNEARGICYFGNERDASNGELWFNNDDMRTHALIFGSTGSGKTEALVSVSFNALTMGSGFIYVDGKGDNSLFAKVFSMVRRMGREDDMLLINFMTGARDVVGPQETRLSNTLNPFSSGSSSMLSQLVVSLMDSGSSSGDGDMWKGRAIAFVEALMKVLVYARDEGYLLLDANSIRNYFVLDRVEPMAIDKALIRDDQEAISLEGAPPSILEPIKNYVINLPGYDKSKKGKQSSQVLEQHGFITMQLTRVFSSLADTYGHIMRHNLAEVDMKDVVLNRRVLVVLLPAMEKSPEELANLGKIIVATLKSMMAAGLGDEVEGDYRDVIERKPTNAKSPFLCVLDEYGYYAVPGFAVVPAQARSLGFSAIFAGQDLPAFQKASKEEAASIGANTNIKICMKLEDPVETWDFFQKTAGESFVTKVDSFQTDSNSMMNNYHDARSASTEKRARIDLLDLKDQREGEAHIFFKSRIIRSKFFYANPKPVKYMRLNQFLKVEPPTNKVLATLAQRLQAFDVIITQQDFTYPQPAQSDDIDNLVKRYRDKKLGAGPIEAAVSILIGYHEQDDGRGTISAATIQDDPIPEDEINIFKTMMSTEFSAEPQPVALLYKPTVREQVAIVERYSDNNEQQSFEIAKEIANDMAIATKYPPEVVQREAESVADMINLLVSSIETVKAQAKTDKEKTK